MPKSGFCFEFLFFEFVVIDAGGLWSQCFFSRLTEFVTR